MTGQKPRLLFVVTEDWFFCSHFLPMAKAAQEAGLDVAIACRVRDHGEVITNLGYRLLPFETDRKSLNPFQVLSAVSRMRQLMAEEKPNIVHLIALRSVIIGGIAARISGIKNRIIALTGMGLIGASAGHKTALSRKGIRWVIRKIVDGRFAHFLFENRSDPMVLGLEPDDRSKVTILGGAGVNPAAFRSEPQPPPQPLRLAMVNRMLWSKGVDTAVEAFKRAQNTGIDVTLSLYGKPDPDNPKSVPDETLASWAKEPGITWHGKVEQAEVPAIWGQHHVALLPSRGGEGLPRSLLEAAACGRAIITTDVPGCRDLVRNGIEGFIVPTDNPQAIADAIIKFSRNAELAGTMGMAARIRVLDGFTEEAVSRAVAGVYKAMLLRSQSAV